MPHTFIEVEPEICIKPDYTQLVVVIVTWEDGVLLIRRQSEPFNGVYSVPGGHKEEGETYHQAACRELNEETGIRTDKLEPLPVFIDDDYKIECHGFRLASRNGHFTSPPDEDQEVIGWKSLDEAIQLPLTPGLRESLQNFRDL